MSSEPTLNYSCSESQTLQLSRYTGLQGGAPFFSEYVFYAEKSGNYNFWYGGSPPGPKEDIYPSYASPFRYSIDDAGQVPVYREDVVVLEAYTPSYYWSNAGEVFLEKGMHKIRFEITEKRRFDGRFYFYLDCFFFINTEGMDAASGNNPVVFPSGFSDSVIDQPFWSISFYENYIKDNPDTVDAYIELSLVYSLLGDFINSIKYLNKALLIEPDNPYILLLIAKNRIWKGDVDEGIRSYRQILDQQPDRVDIRAEAGKVAAWVGKYNESIAFYQGGLELAEDDLNLMVNLGLVKIWLSLADEAEELFQKAFDLASADVKDLKKLGRIYSANGYEDKAVPVYRQAIKLFPEHLEFYLLLEESLINTGEEEEAEKVHSDITEVFETSDRLISLMKIFSEKQGLKQMLIDSYNARLEEQPDNLQLREMLVQTYFWNGMREAAITEYMNILANHAYKHFSNLDDKSVELLKLMDLFHVYKSYFSTFSTLLNEKAAAVKAALTLYNTAVKNNERYNQKVEKAKEKGETAAVPEDGHPADILREAENNLADLQSEIEEISAAFSIRKAGAEADLDNLIPQIAKEKDDDEAFARIIAPLNWRWNRAEMIAELDVVSGRGIRLADYVLGKLYQTEAAYHLAGEKMGLFSEENPSLSALKSLSEIYLWNNKVEEFIGLISPVRDTAESEIPYIVEILELAEDLNPSGPFSGLFTEQTPADIEELISGFNDLKSAAAQMDKDLQSSIRILRTIQNNRLERTIFALQQETYLLRYELGDYLLAENDMDAATSQFNQVLMIDPWNISAVYKLGTVRQLHGDWFQAMKKYKQVFYTDPNYENTANYYNMLAREYADTLSFSASLLGDPSSVIQHGEAAFSTSLNSVFSYNIRYQLDNTRIYKASTVSGYEGDPVLTSHQVHTLLLDLPINLYLLNLKIKPIAGAGFSSSLYENLSNVPQNTLVSVSEYLTSYSVFPRLGGEILWAEDNISVSVKYIYERLKETFIPYRNPVFVHSGELNANFNIPFPGLPDFNGISLRTYAKGAFLSDRNIIGTGVMDVSAGFHLADSPWSTLNLLGTVSFEHSLSKAGLSANYSTLNYYAPNGVLVAKGGVSGSSWIGIGDGDVIGLSMRVAAGAYINTIFDTADTNFYMDGDFRCEFGKGTSSYFISVYGSASITQPFDPEYWSVFVQLGYNAKLPDLLTR